MYQRRPKKFRHRSNGRNQMLRGGSNSTNRLRSNSFSNGQTRNNFRHSLSVEKLFEKYNSLAKEAISSGDKTLAENYLQHADHFMRIIEDKNKSRNQTRINIIDKPVKDEKHSSDTGDIKQNHEAKNKN